MARISPFLKSAIKRGKIALAPNQGTVESLHRRQLVEWHIYTFVDGKRTSQYVSVKATVERLMHRIGMGHPLDAADMTRSSRPQTDNGKAAVKAWLDRRAKAVAKAAKQKTTKLKQALSKPVTQSAPMAPVAPVAQTPTTLPKPPKPSTKPTKKAAKKSVKAKPTAPTTPITTVQLDEPHIILCFDESGSMVDHHRELVAQSSAIAQRLKNELPKATVEICQFSGRGVNWSTAIEASRLSAFYHNCMGGTPLNEALRGAASKAELMSQKHPVLVYLLTDGEATDGERAYDTRNAVRTVLGTNRVTFACVGPAAASSFFKSCGIPDACIRQWSGTDTTDLSVVTQQATQGISQFAAATKQGKTSLDSFFVDVVKTGATVERAKRELSDVTKTLRRVKVNKYITVEDFARDVLKVDLVPGAAYYQLVKAETLLQGRKIILQPRNKQGELEPIFLTGPAVRPLLGLPQEDCKIEPKNLGDFVIYLQSASPTRKLTPGTLCLYDEAHVPGATDPTFTYAKPRKKA